MVRHAVFKNLRQAVMALAIGTATIGSAQASTLLPLIDLSNTFGDLSGAFAENGYTVVFAPFNGGNIFNIPGVELAPGRPTTAGRSSSPQRTCRSSRSSASTSSPTAAAPI